jgi:cardiolipin synthase
MVTDFVEYLALSHLATIITAVGSIIFALQLFRTRRSPQSILAWLLAFVFLPAVAIPSYFLFGTRKLARRREREPRDESDPHKPQRAIERVLWASGIAPSSTTNSFRVLEDGEQAYAELLALIRAAKASIHLSVFILGDDRTGRAVVEALAQRAREGVEVHVMLDAVGSAKSLGRARRFVQAAGGQLRVFTPFLYAALRGRANLRNHRKLAIFDGAQLLTGGMNVAEEYMGATPSPERWKDVAAIASGPIAQAAEALFASDWQFCGGAPSKRGSSLSAASAVGSAQLQLVPSGPDMPDDALYDALLVALGGARARVAVVTPYYVPDDPIQKALELAARRGVRTQLVMPQHSNHPLADFARRSALLELRAAGVELHAYTPGMLHAKAMLVDHDFAFIGSPNLDMRSLYLNYENALFIYDPPHVLAVERWIDALLRACERDRFALERPFWPLEQVARLLAPEL